MASGRASTTHDPQRLRALVEPLSGTAADLAHAVEAAARKQFVLIGEATHGTHEFYKTRAELTKRLIQEHGFAGVAIEGDWPDAHRVHRYVTGQSHDSEPANALDGFKRFPTWMWRNTDVVDFVGWLRSFNDAQQPREKAGFYGLDLYSLYASIQAVIEYLERIDPPAAERAKHRYACFDRFGSDTETYAYAVSSGLTPSCQEEVLAQLLDMQRRSASDDFFAQQNAHVVASAEEYYRSMLNSEISSWNLRDGFMFQTLQRLAAYIEKQRGAPAKIVVWAHNSHVGDARATSMGAGRELNIGQLVRQAYPSACHLIGFTTATGTVTAASNWHGEAERKTVRPPLPGSCEALFQSTGVPKFYLDLQAAANEYPPLGGRMLERAIGVIYLPATEFYSHYLEVRLADQFDALFHYNETRAVQPLEPTAMWETGEVPETFPSGV